MVCTRSSLLVVATSLIILNSVCADYDIAYDKMIKINGKDMTKKSIVFDKSTPDVFYCIPNKPTGEDKIIVRYGYERWPWSICILDLILRLFLHFYKYIFWKFRAKPLHKLCEFEGNPLPEDYKSDCYQDVDESNYACKEKYRIMVSTKTNSDVNILDSIFPSNVTHSCISTSHHS